MPSCSLNVLKLPKRGKEMKIDKEKERKLTELAQFHTDYATVSDVLEYYYKCMYQEFSEMSEEQFNITYNEMRL